MNHFRILRPARIVLSLILGFLLPLGYSFALSTATDYLGTPHDVFVMPFGWPRPVWILLFGPIDPDNDIWPALTFLIVGNVIVYGILVYTALSILAFMRSRRTSTEAPPQAPTFL